MTGSSHCVLELHTYHFVHHSRVITGWGSLVAIQLIQLVWHRDHPVRSQNLLCKIFYYDNLPEFPQVRSSLNGSSHSG